MKIAKFMITGLLWAAGASFTIKGYKELSNGNPEKANSNFIASLFFQAPAIALGCKGWNLKNALAK